MASENESGGAPDWLVPALLIVVGLIAGLAGWGIYELTNRSDFEDASLARQLELYTACLNDHGANVPLVETHSDGGFAVIVPGSLLEHDIDLEQWSAAREECLPLEPDPIGLLFSGGGLGDLSFLFGPGPFDKDNDGFRPGDRFGPGDKIDPPRSGIREFCERVEHGDISGDIDPRELRELCELLNA